MKNKFLEMYELQNTLNVNTNGRYWANGVTLQNRPIDWFRCMYMEAAEAIDSLNWKHWKDINSKDDLENVKIELVDIWHFLMSQHIVNCETVEAATDECFEVYTANGSKEPLGLIQALEGIIVSAATHNLPLELFFIAVNELDDFDMNKVYSLYIGKNCLNQFRQDNGYKDGLYMKIWNGKEDNVYMQNIIDEQPSISYDELYHKLELFYKHK